MDLIRPFQRGDIPAVAELFRWAFARNGDYTPSALETYFERVFFDNPWYDAELPSLVHVDANDSIDGFVGVQPKRLRWRGRRLRVATPTKLMASASAAPLVASRLLRRVFAGPQDLLLSDIGNDAGRRIWEALGGAMVQLYSLQWQRPVRPARHALSWLGARGIPLLVTQVLRPVAVVADHLVARWSAGSARSSMRYSVEDLPLGLLAGRLRDMLPKRALQPEYDEEWLRWFFGIAQQNQPKRVLRRRLVRDERQEVAGWFVYLVEPGGLADVLQVVAGTNASAIVLDALLADALNEGATMVSGRLEPGMLREMSARHCYFRQADNWMLAHSKDREILDAILAGNAFLSRLEGEW